MRKFLLCLTLAAGFVASAQDVKVEFDKDRDLTRYKTFTMGEGEIITPKDQRIVADELLKKWVHDAVVAELTSKGLNQLDSLGDLNVTYIVGSVAMTDVQNLGPMGTSPVS